MKEKMIDMHVWVPWFQELAKKIAAGGEGCLIKRAKQVDWQRDNPALLNYGGKNIDPFSFLYFLAQSNRLIERKKVYESVDTIFEIGRKDLLSCLNRNKFIIPSLPFGTIVLFHKNGKGNPDLLWKLFRQAINGNIDSGVFKSVLNIGNVGVTKLTQTLFLIDPEQFMPVDKGVLESAEWLAKKHYCGIATCNLPSFTEAEREIKQKGLEYYKDILSRFKTAFPNLKFYEINTLLYLLHLRKTGIEK